MITVFSTGSYEVPDATKERLTHVVLPSTEQAVFLGEDLGDTVFHKSIESVEMRRGGRIIFVNASAADSVLTSEVKSLDPFEYWVDRQNLPNLYSCLREGQSLTIRGIKSHNGWLKFLIGQDEKSARSADDLLRGIELAGFDKQLKVDTETPTSVQSIPPVHTFGSLLVNTITPYAKPLKQYLPNSVVVALYKVLEKIR